MDLSFAGKARSVPEGSPNNQGLEAFWNQEPSYFLLNDLCEEELHSEDLLVWFGRLP